MIRLKSQRPCRASQGSPFARLAHPIWLSLWFMTACPSSLPDVDVDGGRVADAGASIDDDSDDQSGDDGEDQSGDGDGDEDGVRLADAGFEDAGFFSDAGAQSDAGAFDGGVLAPTSLVVELSWSPALDLDLLLTKRDGQGRFCKHFDMFIAFDYDSENLESCSNPDADAGMCNYANCKAGATINHPDWDGDGEISAGDPILDNSATGGMGPEVIDVDEVVAGEYLVSIDKFGSPAAFEAEVRISLGGIVQTIPAVRTAEDPDTFDVAIIVVSETGICIDDLSGDNDC